MLDLNVATTTTTAATICITHLRHSDERFRIGIVRSLAHETHYSSTGEEAGERKSEQEKYASRELTLWLINA